jgi:hypothetical protein
MSVASRPASILARLAGLAGLALGSLGCGLDSLALDPAIPANPTLLPKGFAVQTVSVQAGRFEAFVRAPAPPTVSGAGYTVPLGGDRALRCELSGDPWSLASQLRAKIQALGARERVGLVRTSARLGDSGRPYLLAEVLYGPKEAVKGIAQFGAFGSPEGTVVCATEGQTRVVEAQALVENMAESQRWSEENGREKPIYAETSRIFVGDAPMGFEYRYLRRSATRGLSWFKVRGLTGRVNEGTLTAIDDVTIERLDEDRNVREARVLLTSDGQKTYDVTVEREPDGAVMAKGTLSGRAIRRALPSEKPIASDLSLAPQLRDLVAGKVQRVAVRRLVIEGTDLRLGEDEYKPGRGNKVVGPGGVTVAVDETGFVHGVEESDVGDGATLRIERTRLHGAIPPKK